MEYFSKFNRDKHYVALIFWDILTNWIEDSGSQLTKKEKQKLGYAIKHIWDVSQSIFSRYGQDYTNRMLRDLKEKKIEIVRASTLHKNQIQVDIDTLYDIADMAILACNLQNRESCISFHNCQTYKALFSASVPTCVLKTDACPYRGESYDKKTKAWTSELKLPELHIIRPYRQAVCEQCGETWYTDRIEEQQDICPACGGELGKWE